MTHEQADEVIQLLRACHGALADIADAIREHGGQKTLAPKPAPSRRKRPDPPRPVEKATESTRAAKPEGEKP